jgi:hypothetical protein
MQQARDYRFPLSATTFMARVPPMAMVPNKRWSMNAKITRLVLGLSAAVMLVPAVPATSFAAPAYSSDTAQIEQAVPPHDNQNGVLATRPNYAYDDSACSSNCTCPPYYCNSSCAYYYPYNYDYYGGAWGCGWRRHWQGDHGRWHGDHGGWHGEHGGSGHHGR